MWVDRNEGNGRVWMAGKAGNGGLWMMWKEEAKDERMGGAGRKRKAMLGCGWRVKKGTSELWMWIRGKGQ